MKKWIAFFLALITVLSLCACSAGGDDDEDRGSSGSSSKRRNIPSDWEVVPKKLGEELYHVVDFTMDNIGDYMTHTEEKMEIRNEWDELTQVIFYNGIMIPAKNFIQYQTPDDEFLMDINLTVKTYQAKLDPVTLEEIAVVEDSVSQDERSRTVNALNLNRYMASEHYSVDYGKDGKPVLNNDGELIVSKRIITDWKVERVRGHAEWVADIPEKYIMNTKDYSPHDSMIDGANIKFIVFEGEEYYFCYESYGNDDSYQTNGFAKKGKGFFGMGNCISYMRGRE